MKRLIKLTTGHNDINLDRAVTANRFRISMFEFTGGSAIETIHLKIGNHASNYDETTDMYYSLFFLSHISSSITYVPGLQNEGWIHCHDLSNINVQLFINGSLATDITSRNCWLEIEYTV